MKQINHYGTVVSVQKKTLKVKITRYSACHNCDARHGCGLMECQDKTIDVETAHPENFRPGEEVVVSLAQNLGLWAVFLSYVLPLILMLAVLVVLSSLGASEIICGISAIIILIPYYFWLFLSKNRLAGKFRFTVSKITD